MTTFEHAMLGTCGALAAGVHERHGWQAVALAGVAAAAPDWDGLTLLFSNSLFAQSHRVWGHNLLACTLLGVVLGGLDYRFDLVTRVARRLKAWLRLKIPAQHLVVRSQFTLLGLSTWMVLAIVGALSQLPADMVVSGTATLSDWELKPFWPFSQAGYVFPLVQWGDPGITIVFLAGMFAMLWRPSRAKRIARVTLIGVVLYLLARGANW